MKTPSSSKRGKRQRASTPGAGLGSGALVTTDGSVSDASYGSDGSAKPMRVGTASSARRARTRTAKGGLRRANTMSSLDFDEQLSIGSGVSAEGIGGMAPRRASKSAMQRSRTAASDNMGLVRRTSTSSISVRFGESAFGHSPCEILHLCRPDPSSLSHHSPSTI